jgi:quercetin dioxygenase-like cupin family protein
MGGSIRAAIDGQEKVYESGHEFSIPPGTLHQMQNVAGEPGHVIWQTRPALNTEVFF